MDNLTKIVIRVDVTETISSRWRVESNDPLIGSLISCNSILEVQSKISKILDQMNKRGVLSVLHLTWTPC